MAQVATPTKTFDVDKLRATAEKAAERFKVPGVQVVVIQDREVRFAGGFGLRDVAQGQPITEHTVFAHGSTGKSYTALLIGTLVDDGLLTWDSKVRDLVPDFRLSDPIVTAQVSVRDILSHRWGLPRHEFVHLAYPGADRAEMVRRLRDLQLSKELRELFQYSNFGYLLAGHIIGVLTNSTWEEQLRKRVLEPLGMKDTTIGTSEIDSIADRSIAYDDKDGEPVAIPYRSMANMNPAGGLFSSAADVTRYLLCQLNGGEVDGTRVISEASLKETHNLQMPLGAFPSLQGLPLRAYGYGMGWMLGTYRGKHLVEHGGGIDGFTTEFALLPEDGMAVAVCGNHASALPNALTYQVFDQLLGIDDTDWPGIVGEQMEKMEAAFKEGQAPKKTVENAPPAHPLADYAGNYEHPGYGTLDVKADGDQLAVTLGSLAFNNTHRHFETWDLVFPDLGEIKFELTFVTDGSGDVSAAEVNFETALPAIRFPRGADASASDEEALGKLAGSYTLGPITLEIKVEAGPKLVAYQNGTRVDLAPAGKRKFNVPVMPGLTLEFVVDDEGRATQIATPQGTLTRAD
ncbi:MAG TPA: serine hydrolase [Candidatus Dormibacteraeota bacterium]